MLNKTKTSTSKPHPTGPGRVRSRLAALLTFIITSTFSLPLTANDMLQQGQWKGKYIPYNIGDEIDVTYCVQPDHESKPPWKVIMTLDLSSLDYEPTQFEFQDAEEGSLKFRIYIAGVQRECLFKEKTEDELNFECRFVDFESDNTESLTMQRVVPPPDDVCLPDQDSENN